jgi:hypothetical protein
MGYDLNIAKKGHWEGKKEQQYNEVLILHNNVRAKSL